MFLLSAQRVELEVQCDDDKVTLDPPEVGTDIIVIC